MRSQSVSIAPNPKMQLTSALAIEQEAVPHEPARSDNATPPSAGRYLARVSAPSRIERELRAIALDLLGPQDDDELPADCAAWVKSTTEAAASAAGDASLRSLVAVLDSLLAGVTPEIARRLEDARVRHDAGYA